MVCQSVGWLVHDDEICKVIVPHVSQPNHPATEQQGCGDMTIPVVAIRKITELAMSPPEVTDPSYRWADSEPGLVQIQPRS
jgi:hypothetical protein